MTDEQHIHQQYTQVYGLFVQGDYSIGDLIEYQVSKKRGRVIWSYLNKKRHLTYVVAEAAAGFPLEIEASEIEQEENF